MNREKISRRDFLKRTAVVVGGVFLAPVGLKALAEETKRTATDQVVLGKTGLKLSRLGFGTGTNSGAVQRGLGHEGFNRLVRYAYDHGITYIDTAESYRTHEWVREAIMGIPRERLFIQTKIEGVPKNPLEVLDRFRKELNMDYIDSLLTHCATSKTWDEERKSLMDALEQAKQKKIIRAHGASFHSLPALARSAELDWMDVHLVRINPQGSHIDTPAERWNAESDVSHVPAVVEQVKKIRQKRHGVIGMKIMAEGSFTDPADREKSIRFAMQPGLLDAIVIGFKSTAEVDEAINLMNRALAESA
jgi:predicted aldo/keto reductase-like oxidoreductase